MRKIHNYKVIRYFPNSLSEEFINVGVFLEGAEPLDRLLSNAEAKELHCPALLGDRASFLGILEYLNELSNKGILRDSHHYFNNFTFTNVKKVASEKQPVDLIEELFQDYIGYKFRTDIKIPERQIIIQNSFEIAKRHFEGYIKIRPSNLFDIEIESLKRNIIHHSIVGSILNKQDVAKMVMAVPPPTLDRKNKYDFLITTKENYSKKINYLEKLRLNNIDIYDYNNPDKIAKYLEEIAVGA